MQSTAVSTTKASDGLFLSVKTKANARRRKDNEEDEAFDKAEDEQDRAVQELMESSKLIESLREAELKGRERIRYQQERLAALAGSANTVSVKAPLQVRLGMARKAALRTDKAIEEAKATGMFHSHAKKELLGRKKDLDAKRLTKQKQVQQKKGGRGIYGSIGTLKDGIMTLSEHQIESVRRGGSKKKKSTKAFKR